MPLRGAAPSFFSSAAGKLPVEPAKPTVGCERFGGLLRCKYPNKGAKTHEKNIRNEDRRDAEKGMTQLELAEKMGVTDKAVSKWERDLSFPDVNSIPKLAEIFDVTVDELMQGKAAAKGTAAAGRVSAFVRLALKGVALAMGIAVAVLSFLGEIETADAVGMLGIGLAALAITQLSEKD